MKKYIALFLTLLCTIAISGCGADQAPDVTVDYGSSELYTKEDMDAAIALIEAEFNTWDGCALHSITYGSDEACTAENVAWMNDLEAANDDQETFTQCIMFTSEFHSPKEAVGAWEPDTEYTGWQWWLARAEGGDWNLMTWGY